MFRILRNEQGSVAAEYMIIFCFVFIAVIASLAMFNAGGIDANDITSAAKESVNDVKGTVDEYIENDLEGDLAEAQKAKEEIEYSICAKLCKVDYDAGVYNVTQYSNCLGNCSQ